MTVQMVCSAPSLSGSMPPSFSVRNVVICGCGYTGRVAADLFRQRGWSVVVTQRRAAAVPGGVRSVHFSEAASAIASASHLIVTAGPGEEGDPVLAAHAAAVEDAPYLQWICYLSTTGVYGDRSGAWVDENTPPAPQSARSTRRLGAERQWSAFADRRAIDIFRLSGIYGPGRSAFDDLRAGAARRVIAEGHLFGRIHVDDVAGAMLAAATRMGSGVRILHGSDNEPAASADVVAEAAFLLGVPSPPLRSKQDALFGMSAMARSFWAENRKVASRLTQAALDRPWTYPTYREGLRAILAAEQIF